MKMHVVTRAGSVLSMAVLVPMLAGCPPSGGPGPSPGSSASTAAMSPTPPSPPASPTAPAAQVRLSFEHFMTDATRLASLERGVKVMKSRDTADPGSAEYRTSWQYWSAIHGYYGPQAQAGLVADARNSVPASQRHFFNGITDLTKPTAPPNVAQQVWDMCQHGTPHFFTWHRMYLYYFERVLRAAAGDNTLRLPYWDYTDPAQVGFPSTFGQPQFSGQPNALFDDRRRSQTVSLNANATNIDLLLQQSDFFTFQGNVEQQPHGYVHCAVGNGCPIPLMGDVPVAATDPVFWMHHANIDRIWQCWLQRGGQVPGGSFRTQSFDFVDETGSLVSLTVDKLLGPATPIDYTYENVAQCSRTPAPTPSPVVVAAAAAEQMMLDSKSAMAIDAPVKTMTLKLPTSGPMSESLKRAMRPGNAGSKGVELVLDGITVTAPPGVLFDVFLTKKGDAAQRQYVGTLSFFGAGTKHKHGQGTVRRTFDVTTHVKALIGEAAASDAVDVVFEASTGMADSKMEDARGLFNAKSGLKIKSIELKVAK